MKKKMRFGYTTGTCAAAGTKAALLCCFDAPCQSVEVTLPQGEALRIPVEKTEKTVNGAMAVIVKDAGDDPDITDGISVFVEVGLNDSATVTIRGGEGIGIVTKEGLCVPVGEPAINPGPREMILTAAREVLGERKGCVVTISIPNGAALAKRTLNPTLGIQGGLSVIGTSGIVRPMSEEAFKHSLAPQISVAKAAGFDTLVFVPGKIGENAAVAYELPREAIVQTSNFIGYMLEKAAEHEIKRVLLFGHLGKLVKVAAGIFHTHNRVADARMETLSAYLALAGAPQSAVKEILGCTTTEAALPIIAAHHLEAVYAVLAERASLRAQRYVFGDLAVGTAIVTLKGEILGFDSTARTIGEALGWNIKSS